MKYIYYRNIHSTSLWRLNIKTHDVEYKAEGTIRPEHEWEESVETRGNLKRNKSFKRMTKEEVFEQFL